MPKKDALIGKKLAVLFIFLLLIGLVAIAFSKRSASQPPLTLATGTTLYDSGLLDYLLPFFEEEKNYTVRVISLGTGKALELAKNGDADAVLVHAKQRELEMVAQGYFVNRHDVMFNDFVVVGPEADPAGIKGSADAAQLFGSLARKQSPFVSRGDNSGTHKKEQSIWQAAAVSPQGGWYISAGSGMRDTLRMADEKRAYTLTDRGTFLSLRESLDLVILFEDPPKLLNQYGVMAVNPANHPEVNFEGAQAFIEFMISERGQQLIASFKPFGETLYFPNAE